MTQKELNAIRDTALEAIEATGDILMNAWRRHRRAKRPVMEHATKADLTPVTVTDREVEVAIRRLVLSRYPDHSILGEEAGMDGRLKAPYLWAIDPIDGTKPFVRGMRFFGTQIALMHEGRVMVGVSHAPALRETVVAVRGGGAFLNGKRLRVSDVADLSAALIAHGSVRHFAATGNLERLVALNRRVWGTDGFKDFWSYHNLASGCIDAVLEPETNVWDIAAVSLVIEEAGGMVTEYSGAPIGPGSTSIIASNGRIHKALLAASSTHTH